MLLHLNESYMEKNVSTWSVTDPTFPKFSQHYNFISDMKSCVICVIKQRLLLKNNLLYDCDKFCVP